MLVSDLIKFRDTFITKVEQINLDQSFIDMSKVLHSVLMENTSITLPSVEEKINQALAEFEEVHQHINAIRTPLITLVDEINQAVDHLANEILINPEDELFKHYHTLDFIINEEVDRAVRSRIHHRADWHFPGMQLGCRNSEYTSELVANDPLYLCDLELQYIDNVSSQFNDLYNRRLRKYLISNHDLSLLPHNQFGFILSWMLFNYTEITVVEKYLEQVIKILRPGGIIMFSYNNGDLYTSCQLSERGGMSWIPKRQLVKLVTKLGYEIVNSVDLPNNDEVSHISWIEIKKPGQLSTIKRSQAQGLVGRK
jgi:hypothetical protein